MLPFLCVRETRGRVNLEDKDTILKKELENKEEETWKKIMNVLLIEFEKIDNNPEYALQKELVTSTSVREGKKYEPTYEPNAVCWPISPRDCPFS